MHGKTLGMLVSAGLAVLYGSLSISRSPISDTVHFGGDSWEYQSIATNFSAGEGFRFGALLPFEAYRFNSRDPDYFQRFIDAGENGGVFPSYRTPGYPFVLGLIYKVFGVSPHTAIVIQRGWIVFICAFLPLLGRRLLGSGGFAAGLVGGALFFLAAAGMGDRILTEPLIALSLFLVLAAWAFLNRNRTPTVVSGVLFGLALAWALLVKGSMIFLPILFFGYMAWNVLRTQRYPLSVIAVSLVTFVMPLVAYSAYATHNSGSLVVLSTQGDSVLLSSHNEVAVETGDWSLVWQEPTSFHGRQRTLHPERSALLMVISFYAENPQLVVRGLQHKLESMFGTRTALLIGIVLVFGATAFTTCVARSTLLKRILVAGAVLLIPGLVFASTHDMFRAWIVSIAFAPGFVAFVFACSNHCFRKRISAYWSVPGYVAVTFVVVNFVVLTVVTFGHPRFLEPARFVLFLAGAHLLIRLTAALELPVDSSLTLGEEGPGMISAIYRHIRTVVYSRVANELATLTRYSEKLWYWSASEDDLLLEQLPCPRTQVIHSVAEIDRRGKSTDSRDIFVLDGILNSSLDIQEVFLSLRTKIARGDRLAAVLYNPYLRWAYNLADRLGLRSGPTASTFVTRTDLQNLAKISGFEVIRQRSVAPFPLRILGLGSLLNAVMRAVPLIRTLSVVEIAVLRLSAPRNDSPSLTIVIPARNERGNIRSALDRLPEFFGAEVEVVFVEGHSSDGTWDEIQKVISEYGGRINVRAFRQNGKGKSDAVRLGFERASGELLTILDADLTMPPELLPRFYEAYCAGVGDFINGSRLVYPMESQAMRQINRMGNVFFSKAVSWVLEVRLGDTLCGTKLLAARDYRRMIAWREDFGDFDPFGDFELLFPAATLTLGIVDVPIRYRDRLYGSTNISRFRNGLELVRMTLVGLVRLRMGLWHVPTDIRRGKPQPRDP